MNANTKFFAFRQNNSGGSFDHDPDAGIGLAVWIEAVDASHANDRAEAIGLYFDGCESGTDCPCCGDRWYPVSEPDSDIKDYPSLYGEQWREAEADEAPTLDWGIPSYIHPLSGGFKAAVKVAA